MIVLQAYYFENEVNTKKNYDNNKSKHPLTRDEFTRRNGDDAIIYTAFVPANSTAPLCLLDFVTYNKHTNPEWNVYKLRSMYNDSTAKKKKALLQWYRPGNSQRLVDASQQHFKRI